MRLGRSLLAGSPFALLLSCAGPTDTCACPPARTHAVVYGSVRTAAAQPAAGAQVRATVFRSVCEQGLNGIDPDASLVRSDAAGVYRLRFHSMLGPQAVCVGVTARAPGAADSAAAHVALTLRNERVTPDSVRVDLVLP